MMEQFWLFGSNKLQEADDTINIEYVTSDDYYNLSGGYNSSLGDDILLYYYGMDEHILYITHFFE